MRRQAGGAHRIREPHAAVDFHGAGVAPLHFRKECRRLLALDKDGAHAAQPEVDGERQAGGPAAHDDDFRVHDSRQQDPFLQDASYPCGRRIAQAYLAARSK
jgi:hypothetical protein